jgi:hypothetical protein
VSQTLNLEEAAGDGLGAVVNRRVVAAVESERFERVREAVAQEREIGLLQNSSQNPS